MTAPDPQTAAPLAAFDGPQPAPAATQALVQRQGGAQLAVRPGPHPLARRAQLHLAGSLQGGCREARQGKTLPVAMQDLKLDTLQHVLSCARAWITAYGVAPVTQPEAAERGAAHLLAELGDAVPQQAVLGLACEAISQKGATGVLYAEAFRRLHAEA